MFVQHFVGTCIDPDHKPEAPFFAYSLMLSSRPVAVNRTGYDGTSERVMFPGIVAAFSVAARRRLHKFGEIEANGLGFDMAMT